MVTWNENAFRFVSTGLGAMEFGSGPRSTSQIRMGLRLVEHRVMHSACRTGYAPSESGTVRDTSQHSPAGQHRAQHSTAEAERTHLERVNSRIACAIPPPSECPVK